MRSSKASQGSPTVQEVQCVLRQCGPIPSHTPRWLLPVQHLAHCDFFHGRIGLLQPQRGTRILNALNQTEVVHEPIVDAYHAGPGHGAGFSDGKASVEDAPVD